MNYPAAFEELDTELLERGFIFEKEISCRPTYWKRIYHRDNTDFVMKVVDKRLFYTNPDLKESTLREYKIALRIGAAWPNLCCFVDFFYTKGFVVLVYEFYFAGNLEEKMKKGETFEFNEIVLILKNLVMGIEQLKMTGVVHKNLDAGVVYFARSSLKIGGFEFCGFEEQTKMSKTMHNFFISSLITLSSLTPEVIFNQVCSSKTGLFGIGIILYRLYHRGDYPCEPTDLNDLFLFFKSRFSPEISPEVPQPMACLMKSLMQIDYSNRLSFSELKTIVNGLLKELPESKKSTEAIDDFFQSRRSKTLINLSPKPKSPMKNQKTLLNKQMSLPKIEKVDSKQKNNSAFLEPITSPFVKEKKKPQSKLTKRMTISPFKRSSSKPPTDRSNSSQKLNFSASVSPFTPYRSDCFPLKTQSVDLRHIAPRVIYFSDKKDSFSTLNTLPGIFSPFPNEKRRVSVLSKESIKKITIDIQRRAQGSLS